MEQLGLALEAPPPASPERRIDVTLGRVADVHEAMTDAERIYLAGKPYWATVIAVARIRAMERGEEEALGRPARGLADIYDRIVTPGDHPIEALLRTFREQFR